MEFVINNVSSRYFNFKIKQSNHLTKAKKKIELIDIPGRTGALIIDEGARENFTLVISGFMDCRDYNMKEYCEALDNWLNGTVGYQTITFDDGTILKAVFIGEINPNEIIKNFGELSLEFSAYKEVNQ